MSGRRPVARVWLFFAVAAVVLGGGLAALSAAAGGDGAAGLGAFLVGSAAAAAGASLYAVVAGARGAARGETRAAGRVTSAVVLAILAFAFLVSASGVAR